MKHYRIVYDCLLPDDQRVTLLLHTLDRLVIGAGGEPSVNPTAKLVGDEEPDGVGLPRLKRIDGEGL